MGASESIKYNLELIKKGKLIVDDSGRIFKLLDTGYKFRCEYLNGYGYYQLSSYLGNYKYATCLSHRLLFAYYHGIDAINSGLVIHHIDYNKTNNKKDNLIQITKEENSRLGDGSNGFILEVRKDEDDKRRIFK